MSNLLSTGWGRKDVCNPSKNEVLQEIEYKFITNADCNEASGTYKKYIPEQKKCPEKEGSYSGKIKDDMLCAQACEYSVKTQPNLISTNVG